MEKSKGCRAGCWAFYERAEDTSRKQTQIPEKLGDEEGAAEQATAALLITQPRVSLALPPTSQHELQSQHTKGWIRKEWFLYTSWQNIAQNKEIHWTSVQ